MPTDTIICKSCGKEFSGIYCNNCGEKIYTEKDRKIVHLFEEVFHFITHFEGKFFTTLKTIFKHPGKLSFDYCNGIRKKYFKPLSLFLLLIILYLLFPLASGLNMPLEYHMENGRYGEYATKKVTTYLAEHPEKGFVVLKEQFAAKSEKFSKILLLFIVPISALVLWGFSFFRRRYFFDQMVLSAEINSFYLITTFFFLPIFIILCQLILKLLHLSYAWIDDRFYTIIGQIIAGIFVAVSMKRFYNFGTIYRGLAAIVFMYIHGFIVYTLYKFTLFVAVFYQIH